MTSMQTPKQIVTERSQWASQLEIADRQRFQDAVGPALADQAHAAHQESTSNLEHLSQFIRGKPNLEQYAGDAQIRASASLVEYAYDRAKYVCNHATSRAPRPVTALMAADVIACDQCRMPAVLQLGDQHPGACEYCGQPTKTFFPSAFTLAHITVLVDACESCRGELRELLD